MVSQQCPVKEQLFLVACTPSKQGGVQQTQLPNSLLFADVSMYFEYFLPHTSTIADVFFVFQFTQEIQMLVD